MRLLQFFTLFSNKYEYYFMYTFDLVDTYFSECLFMPAVKLKTLMHQMG